MIRALKQHKKSFVFGTILTVIVIVVTVTCVIIFGQQETQTKTITSTPNGNEFSTVTVPMRDGMKLAVDYFSKSIDIALPVILELTPYGRGPQAINYRYEAPFWFDQGFRFVIADCRGTGDSEGKLKFIVGDGQDGYDLVEWISRQSWCNGRIGMRGSSYTGTNQWFVAREKPEHLSCITPSATIGRPMEDIPYQNGAFNLGWAIGWTNKSANIVLPKPSPPFNANASSWIYHRPIRTMDVYATGREIQLYREFLEHPTLDDYWEQFHITGDDYKRMNIPALAFTGWYDGTMYGTIWRHQQSLKYSSNPDEQFLVVGPYTHSNAPDGGYDFLTGEPMLTVGDISVSQNGILPGLNMTLEFFNWCLKNGSRPRWQSTRLFVTGSNQWIERNDFQSIKTRNQSLYLTKNGELRWEQETDSSFDQYIYNPKDPIIVSDYPKPLALPVDVNPLLNRSDMLTYTTRELKTNVTVLGEVVLELKISSTAVDTDYVFLLMDVFPDGRSIRLGSKTASQLRLRYREGYDRQIPMNSNETYRIRIDFHEIGHTFLAGHRIRITITSSFFPWISVNTNNGAPISSDEQETITALQTVFYDRLEPSNLLLPILE